MNWKTSFAVAACCACSLTLSSQKMSVEFAESEMKRAPEAWQLDHGKRLFFGYAQGVGCCAMLDMWHYTGDRKYYDYVAEWADTLINDKGEIHLYEMADYNLDFINSGKVLFDVYAETGDPKYKKAMDVLVRQLTRQPRTHEGAFWHKLIYPYQIWLDGLYMASPFLARYGATFDKPELIDDAVKQFLICARRTFDNRTGLYFHAYDESRNQRWPIPLRAFAQFLGTQHGLVVHGAGRCARLCARESPPSCRSHHDNQGHGRYAARVSGQGRSLVSGARPDRSRRQLSRGFCYVAVYVCLC